LGVIAEDNKLAAKGNTTNTENAVEWHWIWSAIILLIIIATFFVLFTFPIIDGDPWWQMAYGRYLVENRTLIPDHSVFTWSKIESNSIYCAWLGQIILYLIYKLGGLPAFFILRYLCLATFILIVWIYSRKVGLSKHPFTWLVCLLGLLMSVNAGFVKPEIFSYVFICLCVFNWIVIKSGDEKAWKFCYFFPVLMLLWVNTHGAFISGAAFLFMVGLGEELNALYSPRISLSLNIRRHLIFALFLSATAIFLTPYGMEYISYLLKKFFSFNYGHYSTVRAYDSIFSPGKKNFHYVDYLIISNVILISLFALRIREKEFDWTVLLTNGLMVYLYMKFTRSTYLWVPVFTLSAIYLLSLGRQYFNPKSSRIKIIAACIIISFCFALGARAAYDRLYRSYGYLWFGYGISYIQPVEETEFIRQHLTEYKIANDYNIGGYLLWELGPENKFLIDPRYFPFKNWYGEYHQFEQGINISAFLNKTSADVWCIQHLLKKPINWFINSPKWRLIFYGPSSAIFIRSDIVLSKNLPRLADGLDNIKNFNQAQQVLKFATEIKNWHAAEKILKGMKKQYWIKRQAKAVQSWENLIDGLTAYHQRDYQEAAYYLAEAKKSKLVWSDSMLVNALLQTAVEHWTVKEDEAARRALKSALEIKPNNALAMYNMGVIEWYINAIENAAQDSDHKSYLMKFIQGSRNLKSIPDVSRQIALSILNGTYTKRPILLKPKPPPLYEPDVISLEEDTRGISLLP
jgi:hypothetical protein